MTRIIPLLIFVLVVVSGKSQAPLSLSDAIQLGLANNYGILISKGQQEIARNSNTFGNAGGLPTITLSAVQSNNWNDQDNPASLLNGVIETHSIRPAADLNWTLFNGFNVLANRKRLGVLERQSAGNTELIVQNTIEGIVLAYYNVVLQKENLKVLGDVKRLSRDEYTYVSTKTELGAAGTFDLLQAKDAYLTDSTNYINQQVQQRTAERALNTLLALPPDTGFIFTDSVLPQPEIFYLEVLKEAAHANNQNIKLAYLDQELRRQDTRLQKSALYPSLSVAAGINDSRFNTIIDGENNFSGQPFVEENAGRTLNYFVNITLSYRLYDGGKVRTTIENAQTQEAISANQTQQATQAVMQELHNAFDTYQSQVQLLGIAQESVDNAALNLEIGKDKFNAGSITSFEFRDIQIRYIRSSFSRLSTAYQVISSRTNLSRLTGTLVAP